MKKFISSIDKRNSVVIILTAREYWHYSLTKRWIKLNELDVDGLIVVSRPNEKVLLLNKVVAECEYYDDMSYNHENHNIKFYIDEIDNIKEMSNISYHDYDAIKAINRVE